MHGSSWSYFGHIELASPDKEHAEASADLTQKCTTAIKKPRSMHCIAQHLLFARCTGHKTDLTLANCTASWLLIVDSTEAVTSACISLKSALKGRDPKLASICGRYEFWAFTPASTQDARYLQVKQGALRTTHHKCNRRSLRRLVDYLSAPCRLPLNSDALFSRLIKKLWGEVTKARIHYLFIWCSQSYLHNTTI